MSSVFRRKFEIFLGNFLGRGSEEGWGSGGGLGRNGGKFPSRACRGDEKFAFRLWRGKKQVILSPFPFPLYPLFFFVK